MSKKPIPEGVMHTPKPITWAQLTPLSEHKKREAAGVELTVVPDNNGTKREPLPLSRATTELRRAYPYIFDCASYALTHAPKMIDTDLFYSRFTMPYSVFLDYCLDDCADDQMEYLKNELYKLFKGQPAKHIKVSEHRSVWAQPVIIAFSRTDPKTGKEKTVKNIGHDKLVNLVQIQIIKELLTFEHGFINQPKAFYAKTRRIYNALRETSRVFDGLSEQEAIATARKHISFKMDDAATKKFVTNMQNQGEILDDMEQGGFHALYLALEYILARKKRGIKRQEYSFLDLCDKCAPELTQSKNGTLYFKDKSKVKAFLVTLQLFTVALSLSNEKAIGIYGIDLASVSENDMLLTVVFT
jgi:hypothetical protein